MQYIESSSKSNSGGIKSVNYKPKEVLAFKNIIHPERCIISLFQLYTSHRPPCVERFYLTALKQNDAVVWYSVQPMGINTIKKVVSNMCKEGGFAGYYTNHSLRATSATRLFQNGVEEQLVAQITGHRSLAVRSYKRPSMQQLNDLSNVIQGNRYKSTDQIEKLELIASSSNQDISTMTFTSSKVHATNKEMSANFSPDVDRVTIGQPANKKLSLQIDGNANIIKIQFD